MGKTLDAPLVAFWSAGGALVAFAALLLTLLVLTLPSPSRRKLRIPAVLVVLYGAVVVLRVAHARAAAVTWVELCGVALLWVALARVLGLLVFESSLAKRVLPPLPKIFEDLLQAFLYLLAVLATLRFAGIDTSSLLTTSAILSAVIGFALQDTLGNVFAGLSIQAQRPFAVGDWVEVDGNVGRVLEIGWRATKVLTLDEVEIIVPNGALAKHTIKNFTKPTLVSRRSVELSAPFEVPPGRVKDVVLAALEGLPGASPARAPAPRVVVRGFGESSMLYTLYYFTDDFAAAVVTDGLVRDRVWYAFRRARIAIPFPQREVRVHDTSLEARSAEEAEHTTARGAALAAVAFFDVIPSDVRGALAERCSERLYAAGETILRQGESGDELFVVLRGEVAILVDATPSSGRPMEVARLGRSEFFGERSLLTGEVRAATVRATTECALLVVGHDAFQEVLDAHPELAERLSVRLAERQIQLDEQKVEAPVESQRVLAERSSEILAKIRAFFVKRR